MKKLVLIAFALVMGIQGMQAQEVFLEVMKMSREVAEDKTKDMATRKIATFKYDQLTYMYNKVLPIVLKDTTNTEVITKNMQMLDEQAYAMYMFCHMFVEKLAKAKKDKERSDIMSTFKNASLNNPYFNDDDKEFVNAYVDHPDFLTHFSLDTDFVKALAEIKQKYNIKE